MVSRHGRWAASQVLDQAQLSGVGDVGIACRLGWTTEQEPAAGIGEDHGLDRVLLVLAGDELLPVLATDGGPADPDLGSVDDPGLPAGAEVTDDLGEGAEPDAGGDGAAAGCEQGRTSPIARVIVERSTPNQQASTS
ncbi:hypothetical protein GCM10010218_65890 [Streptomyces mashuensis]|uniref:Uncharacterized protein n=1 Tax=Streptomyces mashuensis TaxID=33904 RepID=A0A919EFP8_9ACTN|nr:hypothetical protein GCM10010218_65890 [Streptomyces mashuensis]